MSSLKYDSVLYPFIFHSSSCWTFWAISRANRQFKKNKRKHQMINLSILVYVNFILDIVDNLIWCVWCLCYFWYHQMEYMWPGQVTSCRYSNVAWGDCDPASWTRTKTVHLVKDRRYRWYSVWVLSSSFST